MKEEFIDIRRWRRLLAEAKIRCEIEMRATNERLKALNKERSRLEGLLRELEVGGRDAKRLSGSS